MELKLTSPLPPSVNHYTAVRTIVKDNRPMAIVYKTAEAKKYQSNFKKYLIQEVKSQGWNLELNKYQHFYIDCVYYFDRIDKDPSNYDKCLLDSITDTQLIWIDDNVACPRVQRIYYDSDNPRIDLTIKPVEYIGIFDDVSHLSKFKDKCIRCVRYKDGKCSILNKAMIGKIQSDINDFKCNKFKERKV